MNDAKFEQLLATSELAKVDFKQTLYRLDNDHLKSEFVKDILALANTNPPEEYAYILLGIKDDSRHGKKDRLGLETHHDDNDLQLLVKDKVTPIPDFVYAQFSQSGKQYGIIRVTPSRQLCQATRDFGVLRKDVFYTRKGTRNSEAAPHDIEVLTLARLKAFTMPQVTESAEALALERRAQKSPVVPAQPSDLGKVVGRGDKLRVRFDKRLNTKWKDPLAIVAGSVMPDGSLKEIRWPLNLRAAGSIEESYRWLCIPSFGVEMEWREHTYVIDNPLWRRIKEHAVKSFIKRAEGKLTDAVVLSIGRKQGKSYAYLSCADYDAFLSDNWPYYRGLEAALRRTGIAANAEVAGLSEKDLEKFTAEILLPSGQLTRLLPSNYERAVKAHAADSGAIAAVLMGLIEEARP